MFAKLVVDIPLDSVIILGVGPSFQVPCAKYRSTDVIMLFPSVPDLWYS